MFVKNLYNQHVTDSTKRQETVFESTT